ncbi:Rad9 protein [Entamoeba marina]
MSFTPNSPDLLQRNTTPESSFLTESQHQVEAQPGSFHCSTKCFKTIQTTLQLLNNKNVKDLAASVWIDAESIKIITEETSVYQSIIVWSRDMFTSYHITLEGDNNNILIKLPLKSLVLFFEGTPEGTTGTVSIYYQKHQSILFDITSNGFSSKISITPISGNIEVTEFEMNRGELALWIEAKPEFLAPTFKTLEWTHPNLTITTKENGNDSTVTFASESLSDSIVTSYDGSCFERFEVYGSVDVSFKLSLFQGIKRALEKSKFVTILLSEEKILYVECSYEIEQSNLESEIGFYMCSNSGNN